MRYRAQERQDIENPWVVWTHGVWPSGLGRVVDEGPHSVSILYSEGQMYLPQCWAKESTKRFPTYGKALDYFVKHRGGVTKPEADKIFQRSFPEALRQERAQQTQNPTETSQS